MKANVYVDGFNLYYGCLRGTPYKWLNLEALIKRVFPKYNINRIRYFTARIRAFPADPQKPARQQLLIRALLTIPCLSVHYGHFLSHVVRLPLANPPPNGPDTADVIRTEEKGSDVNLATFLLVDAFAGDFDVAIVVSNDSDLCEPISFVTTKLRLPVGVLNPHKRPSQELLKIATFHRSIRRTTLAACQFPSSLHDSRGSFTKPPSW